MVISNMSISVLFNILPSDSAICRTGLATESGITSSIWKAMDPTYAVQYHTSYSFSDRLFGFAAAFLAKSFSGVVIALTVMAVSYTHLTLPTNREV